MPDYNHLNLELTSCICMFLKVFFKPIRKRGACVYVDKQSLTSENVLHPVLLAL